VDGTSVTGNGFVRSQPPGTILASAISVRRTIEDGAVPSGYMVGGRVMAEKMLDCLGEACPVPLIRTQKAINELAVGDVLVVAIDHSCAMKNIPEWAGKEGHNYEIEEVSEGQWEIVIEKSH
jgi:tRNA 2-thiouridine synthesizing protein A